MDTNSSEIPYYDPRKQVQVEKKLKSLTSFPDVTDAKIDKVAKKLLNKLESSIDDFLASAEKFDTSSPLVDYEKSMQKHFYGVNVVPLKDVEELESLLQRPIHPSEYKLLYLSNTIEIIKEIKTEDPNILKEKILNEKDLINKAVKAILPKASNETIKVLSQISWKESTPIKTIKSYLELGYSEEETDLLAKNYLLEPCVSDARYFHGLLNRKLSQDEINHLSRASSTHVRKMLEEIKTLDKAKIEKWRTTPLKSLEEMKKEWVKTLIPEAVDDDIPKIIDVFEYIMKNSKNNEMRAAPIKAFLDLGYSSHDILILARKSVLHELMSVYKPKSFDSEKIATVIKSMNKRNWKAFEKNQIIDGPLFDVATWVWMGENVDFDQNLNSFNEVEDWEKYVVRKDNWEKFYANYSQKRYGSHMHRGSLLAKSGIENNWPFLKVLAVLSLQRNLITIDQKSPIQDQFGKIRRKSEPAITLLKGQYIGIEKSMREQWDEKQRDYCEKEDDGFATYGFIEENRIPLSKICPNEEYLRHTEPEYIPIILEHVDKLFYKALKVDNIEILDKAVGEIFWWICKAKPWIRGDPSIAEMLIKGIYLAKGFEVPAWKIGIIPWLKVELTPNVKKFADHFFELLDRS